MMQDPKPPPPTGTVLLRLFANLRFGQNVHCLMRQAFNPINWDGKVYTSVSVSYTPIKVYSSNHSQPKQKLLKRNY